MFDLKPRVHFQEEEAAILAGDKLDSSRAVVPDGLGQRDGLLAHLLARSFVEQRTWCFLDDFLVTALNGAFPLAEIDDVAMLVAKHLDFDVARIDDEFLDEDAVVAEARLGFRAGADKALGNFVAAMGDAHALTAAAG